jgi:hypothetical protein
MLTPVRDLKGVALVWALHHVLAAVAEFEGEFERDGVVALKRDGAPEVWYRCNVADVTNDERRCYSEPPFVDEAGNPRFVGEAGQRYSIFGSPVEIDADLVIRLCHNYLVRVEPTTGLLNPYPGMVPVDKQWAASVILKDGARGEYGATIGDAVAKTIVSMFEGTTTNVPDILLEKQT